MTNISENRIANSSHVVYLFIIGSVFLALTVLFLFLPRSTFSELEKRDLAEFPDYANYKGKLADYTSDISTWFSDSEPYRDHFMTFSMNLRHALSYRHGDADDAISFKPADTPIAAEANPGMLQEGEAGLSDYQLSDVNAKAASSGTIIIGSGSSVRALMAFGGSSKSGDKIVNAARVYHDAFPGVNIYTLVAPLATEFYLPEKGKSLSKPQKPVLDYIRQSLPAGVKYVDVHSAIGDHIDEDVYLRTDHHWAPLGAFYAARAFAHTAGVPFKELDSYDSHVIHNFVGSMYGYSHDISVKNAPEDFVYYTPRGLNYKTTYTTFHTDKGFYITSASKPYQGQFFHKFNNGSSNAYLTFMGGDQSLVKVSTGTPSSRKLLIIKDSYGNAVPGYLFYSFGEVHVVDFRYFPYSLREYVKNNGITDIVLAFNIFNACSVPNMKRVIDLIDRPTGFGAPSSEKDTSVEKDANAESSMKSDKAPAASSSETTPVPPKEEPAEIPKESPEESVSEESI